MGKKNRRSEPAPEGMSRREAKRLAREKERAALVEARRPYAGYACEAELIALQEFLSSAVGDIRINGCDDTIHLCTVLPEGCCALVRDDGGTIIRIVALQTVTRGSSKAQDLAHALDWVRTAKPGDQLRAQKADRETLDLAEIFPPDQQIDIAVYDNFSYWYNAEQLKDPAIKNYYDNVNKQCTPNGIIPADIKGLATMITRNDREMIVWCRTDDEDTFINALARASVAGLVNLLDDTRFLGIFRIAGIVAPAFECSHSRPVEDFVAPFETLNAFIDEHWADDAPLTSEERAARERIKSRSLTVAV